MSLDTQTNSWTAKQAYGLAIVCLLVGILAGYLAHTPKSTLPGAAVAAPATESATPAVALNANPSPEDMKTASSQAAMPVLERLKSDPKNFDLLIAAGEMYYHHRAFTEAGSYYERALAVKDDVAVRNQYASALFYEGKADAALEQYATVLKKSPTNDVALFNSGMIRLKSKNDAKGAIAFWEKLLKTSPNHPQRDQVKKMIEKASQQQS